MRLLCPRRESLHQIINNAASLARTFGRRRTTDDDLHQKHMGHQSRPLLHTKTPKTGFKAAHRDRGRRLWIGPKPSLESARLRRVLKGSRRARALTGSRLRHVHMCTTGEVMDKEKGERRQKGKRHFAESVWCFFSFSLSSSLARDLLTPRSFLGCCFVGARGLSPRARALSFSCSLCWCYQKPLFFAPPAAVFGCFFRVSSSIPKL